MEIIRYRFIDKLSWDAVAYKMGENNTEDGMRMAVLRYLKKSKSYWVCSFSI